MVSVSRPSHSRSTSVEDAPRSPETPIPCKKNSVVALILDILTSHVPEVRNLSLVDVSEKVIENHDAGDVAAAWPWAECCEALEAFRKDANRNLYQRVRAGFFLYAIYRYYLLGVNSKGNGGCSQFPSAGPIPYHAAECLRERQYEAAIAESRRVPLSLTVASVLVDAYHGWSLQCLSKQVQISVRAFAPNAWMFDSNTAVGRYSIQFPDERRVLRESTPVRLDFSHAGWSDIFFLAMDYPEGAQVVNLSIDLSVVDPKQLLPTTSVVATQQQRPPIDSYLQILDRPVLRLTSIDLQAEVELTTVDQVFDFGKDYLGLLRAGIVASGLIPPALEALGKEKKLPLSHVFRSLLGSPDKGLHLTTQVHNIPKGSRLAVSTNLLASIIALCMRASGQCGNSGVATGELPEVQRRVVAARAILGEWLGGSGGGWQDSGGVWPGLKWIRGMPVSGPHQVEYGSSRGQLLPQHTLLDVSPALNQALQEHLVLFHGGMAMNVGPVLELVTEKYLLREPREWQARAQALGLLDDVLDVLKPGDSESAVDVRRLAKLTTQNFWGPLQDIIPGATNAFTETIIERIQETFKDDYWGFCMLGGASGGGMGLWLSADAKRTRLFEVYEILISSKRAMEQTIPFAMDPVIYDFAINRCGTVAEWTDKAPTKTASQAESAADSSSDRENMACSARTSQTLDEILDSLGFDTEEHELLRQDYCAGSIGLSQNRLPPTTILDDASHDDVLDTRDIDTSMKQSGIDALQRGMVGVVTLAAGVGSRWSGGAGCVKALSPFVKLDGHHRSFLDVHRAKCLKTHRQYGTPLMHVVTTSHMTDDAIRGHLNRSRCSAGPLLVSKGRTIGLRLIPACRDLQFSWEKESKLDDQAQKVRESCHGALQEWAKTSGEGSDYRDNLPWQCLHPVGHYYEIPNLFLNGTLQKMLHERPQLQYLMLHNVDTVGANVDPGLLGLFIRQQKTLSFEVIPRRIEDAGGGLARVNGKIQLVEGMALPTEEDECKLSYYNSMTTWIHVDKLLSVYGLTRSDIDDQEKIRSAIQIFSRKLPTYSTIKEVRKRWGRGHEDIFPTVQFEKLWSDMTALEEVDCDFFLVPRERGQQLKDVSQLSGFLRNGSADHLTAICNWDT